MPGVAVSVKGAAGKGGASLTTRPLGVWTSSDFASGSVTSVTARPVG